MLDEGVGGLVQLLERVAKEDVSVQDEVYLFSDGDDRKRVGEPGQREVGGNQGAAGRKGNGVVALMDGDGGGAGAVGVRAGNVRRDGGGGCQVENVVGR